MGNTVVPKSSFNLRENDDLDQFLSSINMLDGFYMDTTLSISSKCLLIINNLINGLETGTINLMSGVEVHKDDNMIDKIRRLQFHCGLIRHLAVVNSAIVSVEELVDLNNLQHLTSLTIDHVPIRFVQHLKKHRETLFRLSVHYSLNNLESVIDLCGRDHSFSDNWSNLHHLDVRYNHLRIVDDSVVLLTSLTVLDISRNDIDDLSFIKKIPTLLCLNASFNYIRSLPSSCNHQLRVLIIAYNYLDGLEGIKGFKKLSTLNVAYNMIASNDYLQQLKEMDFLKDLILKGNPLFYSQDYRRSVLDVVSTRVPARFAIDGKFLNKKEEVYFRKRPMILISPALPPLSQLYIDVPVIVKSNPPSDFGNSSSQSNTKRIFNFSIIQSQSDFPPNTNGNGLLRKISSPHDERRIESLSCSGTLDLLSFGATIVFPNPQLAATLEQSVVPNPSYVGEKSSNLFAVFGGSDRKTFINVSIQIFDHKLMSVDNFDVTVDNVDLWTLMVVNYDSTFLIVDTDKILKLIFFWSCDKENPEKLVLSTRRYEFVDSFELKRFLGQLNMYLNGFSLSCENWDMLPLVNLTMKCTQCTTALVPSSGKLRPYLCHNCAGTAFLLQSTLPEAAKESDIEESTVASLKYVRKRNNTLLTPGPRKHVSKSPTGDLFKRVFGSSESLPGRAIDQEDVHSGNASADDTSYHTAINDSLLNNSERSLFLSPSGSNDQLVSSTGGSTPNNERDQPLEMDLDIAINNPIFDIDISIDPHDCQEDNEAYALLKSSFKTPWLVHEESCDISIHMHNSRKIDDRVKLHFLTKVTHSEEDLVSVFKVYLAYRSTGMATKALVILTNVRLMIFHLLDKTSTSMEECIKQVCEFNLKSLQRLEYCLNNQWLELQFKKKPPLTFLIGDSDSVKNISVSIIETVSEYAGKFSVTSSKSMEQLKCPKLLSTMAMAIGDEASMDTIFKSESYLIDSSSVLPSNEKSSSEYGPKMVVLEAERIFFVTFLYSGKGPQAVFELARIISLFSLKGVLFVDSLDDCSLRMEICEAGQDQAVEIRFLSSHSRARAAICIDRLWRALFHVDLEFQLDRVI